MTLQSLIISKNIKMKKNYWTSIVIYFPMKYVDVLYTIREQQAMCWILVSIRILTSTISITIIHWGQSDCMKFDDHPYCINHSDLRMDTGRTNRHIMYGNSFFNIKMENFKLIIILLNLYLWVLPVCRFGNFFKNYFSNMKLRYNESKLKMISFVWCMNIISTWKC